MTFQYGRRPPYWMCKYVSMEMDPNDKNNIIKKFCMPKLVKIEVLHVKMIKEQRR